MRSPFLSRVLIAAALALLAGGLLGCDACKKKETKKELGAAEGAGDSDDAPEVEAKPGIARKRAVASNFKPITVEEVKPLIPPLPGASMIGEPKLIAGGRRVNVLQCVNSLDPTAVKAELEKSLGGVGFADLVQETRHQPQKDRIIHTMRAQKDGVVISAVMRYGEYPDCKKSENKTKVFLTFFKGAIKRHGQEAEQQGGAQGAAGSGAAPGAAEKAAPAEPAKQSTVDASPG